MSVLDQYCTCMVNLLWYLHHVILQCESLWFVHFVIDVDYADCRPSSTVWNWRTSDHYITKINILRRWFGCIKFILCVNHEPQNHLHSLHKALIKTCFKILARVAYYLYVWTYICNESVKNCSLFCTVIVRFCIKWHLLIRRIILYL